MNLPSGPQSPYWWQLLQILFKPTGSLSKWSEIYGDTFKLGGKRKPSTISFSSPEAIRTILNAPPEVIGYVQKSYLMKSLLGDKSLIFLPEPEHQSQRKLIIPSFHQVGLKVLGTEIINITKNTLINLESSDSFKVRSVMKEISLRVLVAFVFGDIKHSNNKKIEKIISEMFDLFESPSFIFYLLILAKLIPFFLEKEMGVWKKYKQLQKELEFLIKTEIIENFNNRSNTEKNLLSLLTVAQYENGQKMTEQEIYDAIMTLIFAGFETAAAATSWMLYWVHYIPEVKKKLSEEISNIDIDIDPMKVMHLPYLDAVYNETLRITPPARSAFARTVKQGIKIEDYYLEPGTNIDITIYLAHQRKSVYPDPHLFKPERFLQRQFSPYEYLPFGGGQCRCIGASLAQYEMKLILTTIINNFELEIIDPKPLKPKLHGVVMIPPKLKMKVNSSK